MKLNKVVIAVIFIAVAVLAQTHLPPEIANITTPDKEIASETNAPSPAAAAVIPTQNTKTNAINTTPEIPAQAAAVAETGSDEDTDFIALPVDSAPIEGITATNNADENLITISFDDVSIEDVVRMFRRIPDANIIATPSNLSAHVTANLDGVEWRPALSTILSMHNLSLSEKPAGSGVYSIVPRSADAPEPLIVETVFLEYTTVAEVSPVVTTMLPERGSLSLFTSRNALVIRSTEANLAEIKEIIKDIDIQSKQVCIEALFMELSDSATKQLGIRWDSLEGLGVGIKTDPFSISRETERIQSRNDALSQINNRSSKDELETLYDQYGSPVPTRTVSDTIEQARNASSDISDNFSKVIKESQAAVLNIADFNIVLSALKKMDGVSVVSNPKMIVANGDTNAYFRVGERLPITKETISDAPNQASSDKTILELDTSINTDYIKGGYLHTGIELKVIPTVKTDGLIEAIIEPSLRRDITKLEIIDGELTRPQYPQISVKEIKTRFTLESGQTVAIGGLTDTSTEKVTSKIPLLGDIPLIGKYLFSHTKDSKKQVETIIFVTLSIANPHTLRESEAIPGRARLVQKRMIKDRVDQHHFDQELEELDKAADREINESKAGDSEDNPE